MQELKDLLVYYKALALEQDDADWELTYQYQVVNIEHEIQRREKAIALVTGVKA